MSKNKGQFRKREPSLKKGKPLCERSVGELFRLEAQTRRDRLLLLQAPARYRNLHTETLTAYEAELTAISDAIDACEHPVPPQILDERREQCRIEAKECARQAEELAKQAGELNKRARELDGQARLLYKRADELHDSARSDAEIEMDQIGDGWKTKDEDTGLTRITTASGRTALLDGGMGCCPEKLYAYIHDMQGEPREGDTLVCGCRMLKGSRLVYDGGHWRHRC